MPTLAEAAREFLSHKRVAVAGVSRNGDTAANAIYRKLRDGGFTVFSVNPNGGEIEGDRAWETISSIPGGVEGVVIATHPAVAAQLVRECAALGIPRVWMHRSVGGGSVDDGAVRLARDLGLAVIPGSCPMMFCEPVDLPHKCMRWVLRATRHEAQPQGYAS